MRSSSINRRGSEESDDGEFAQVNNENGQTHIVISSYRQTNVPNIK